MNTPRSKSIVRYNLRRPSKKKRQDHPDGTYTGGLHNPAFLNLLGQIVTYLPQIEERMIDIMALMMGGRGSPAREVFRSLNSEDARVKIMRAMLEHSHSNTDKGQEFDEVIDLFVEVKNARNAYVHGLWETHSTGRAFLSEPSSDLVAAFLSQREVTLGELEKTLARMSELWRKTLAISYPEVFGPNRKLPTSPQTLPPQPPPDR